jgi:DNA repair exonuclease SbcCD ATPase subunit
VRFVRLVVDRFQGIEHAELDFARGLNVLHGPNEIGKSTLATAMRAVLLLPPGSTEAAEYTPWQGDHTPQVQLTFCDQKGIHYRVTKSFGSGPRASAKLERARDGSSFDTEATARQVEEKLRTLLDWGIPPPGGNVGAKKGLPEAFLSRVLLGEQTDVDAILDSSFEDDPDPAESGRLRLASALQAFAQDPHFKSVLDQAQAKVDELFTPTGQRKRGKGSPFLAAAEDVKQLQLQLQELQERQEESGRAESRVRLLLTELQTLRERRHNETALLGDTEKRLAMAEARAEAVAEVEVAEGALRQIDVQWELVNKKAQELTTLEAALAELKSGLEKANGQLESAKAELASATDEWRRETSDEAALQRTLKKAQIENSIGKLDARQSELQIITKAIEEAARCAKAFAALETQRDTKDRERVAISTRIERILSAQMEAGEMLGRLEDLEAYGRWTSAHGTAEAAEAAAAGVKRLESASRQLQGEVDRLLAAAASITAPSVDEVRAVEQLEHELALAEAALGGGLSVAIRPAEGVEVRLKVDGQATTLPGAGQTLEAARTLDVAIPGVVELEVFAGDADGRRRAEALRRRWSNEARPVLEKAGAANAAAVRALRAKADEVARGASEKAKERESVEREAAGLRGNALTVEDLRRRAAELEVALDGRDREALAALHAGLKRGWEADVEKSRKALEEQKRKAAAELLEVRTSSGRLDGEIGQLESQLKGARVALEDAQQKILGGSDPARQLSLIEAETQRADAARLALQKELSELEQEVNLSAQAAGRRVEDAKTALESANRGQTAASGQIERHRSELDQARGQHGALKTSAEGLARDAAVELVKAKKATLAAVPIPSAPATVDDRDRARQRVDSLALEFQAKSEELSRAEGALTHVGGAVVAEQCAEMRSALSEAAARQKTLETDAQAWRLLREVLQESESVGMKHLGRVLGDDVGHRFQSLTKNRYGAVELGPQGNTLGVHAEGSARSVMALSVGTREQLATLLRLAIAESLGSAIVLDDHLVEADPARLQWFLDVLRRSADTIQVIVLTCRRRDYEGAGAAGSSGPVTWVDANHAIRRWPGTVSRSATT